jgi:hypothetical protein
MSGRSLTGEGGIPDDECIDTLVLELTIHDSGVGVDLEVKVIQIPPLRLYETISSPLQHLQKNSFQL